MNKLIALSKPSLFTTGFLSLCLSGWCGVLVRGPETVGSGPHHRVVRQVWEVIDARGQAVLVTNLYTELASGLNRYDEAVKRWVISKAEFEQSRSGHLIGRQSQYKVILSPNLAEEGAVDLLCPDGVRLRSTILGVALVDVSSGESVLLGEVKPCRPDWVAANQVVYRDAFDGLAADVRYTISPDRFEQDLILREGILPEVVIGFGIDPRNARVAVLTEFFDAPLLKAGNALGRGQQERADDKEICFGLMSIGLGQAFGVGTDSGKGFGKRIRVGRSWELLEGRRFLVEYVDYVELGPLMDGLSVVEPAGTGGSNPRRWRRASATGGPQLPRRPEPIRQAGADIPRFRDGFIVVEEPLRSWASLPHKDGIETALAVSKAGADPGKGVVVDYALELIGGLTNHVFRADSTYLVSGTVNLMGTTVFEGGTVIKLSATPTAGIVCHGPIDCRTGPYYPAVFTARDDDTVGEPVADSSRNPWTNHYGNVALTVRVGGQVLRHMRIAHARTGLCYPRDSANGQPCVIGHCQFVHCGDAIAAEGYAQSAPQYLQLQNVLIDRVGRAVCGSDFDCRIEHLSLHDCGQLGCNSGSMARLSLTNSLLVAVSNVGNVVVNQSHCRWAASSNEVFRTVGAGGFYLAGHRWRNAGTTNIDPVLAAELKRSTTYAPIVLSGLITAPSRLDPQAGLDSDLPDLGYHYPPIDYAVGSLTITNAGKLTLGAGVAVASFGNHGLRVENCGLLVAEGTPLAPVRLFRYNIVQEQSIDWGPTTYEPATLTGPCHDTAGADAAPTAELRFAQLSGLGGYGHHVYTDNGWFMFKSLLLRDCIIWGGKAQFSGTTAATIGLSNNLFVRVFNRYFAWPELSVYNNLFWGGSNRLERFQTARAWTFRDNAFDNTGLISLNAGVLNDHNAYIGSAQYRLAGSAGGDVLLGGFAYTNSFVGGFYHGSTNLVNRGSRSAAAAGLYHYTVRTDQTKEANSTVDIGFHYPATDTRGKPLDSDGDGLADWTEDRNGNGTCEAGETNWLNSENGTTGVAALQLFTPLEQ